MTSFYESQILKRLRLLDIATVLSNIKTLTVLDCILLFSAGFRVLAAKDLSSGKNVVNLRPENTRWGPKTQLWPTLTTALHYAYYRTPLWSNHAPKQHSQKSDIGTFTLKTSSILLTLFSQL